MKTKQLTVSHGERSKPVIGLDRYLWMKGIERILFGLCDGQKREHSGKWK